MLHQYQQELLPHQHGYQPLPASERGPEQRRQSGGGTGFNPNSTLGSTLSQVSQASVPVIVVNEVVSVAEGGPGPLEAGPTALTQVATRLSNMFEMTDKEARKAKMLVQFFQEKVEDATITLKSGQTLDQLSTQLTDMLQRQERLIYLLERRGVPATSRITKTPRHGGVSQLLEYSQLQRLLQRVWRLQEMLVKDALVDDFEDEDGVTEADVVADVEGGRVEGAELADTAKSGATNTSCQLTPLKAHPVPVLKQTDAELGSVPHIYKAATKFNPVGTLVFLLYLLALIFYLYVRVAYTLALGNAYVVYGAIVFVAELGGALAMIIYGITVIKTPRDQFPNMAEVGGIPATRDQYHIRVLIPCYSESFEIVQRTAQAAYMAPVPFGCRKCVYICDDGKDPKKRKWVEAQGTGDLVYVSGRIRAKGEVNGKSGNLNNCMRNLIYRNVRPNRISRREIVVIFDADMVCSKEFFLKTVPYFDLGDNVGMVLSPQCFHNVDPDADILNHQNIHFWEYMQPGFDAMDFISCTGVPRHW